MSAPAADATADPTGVLRLEVGRLRARERRRRFPLAVAVGTLGGERSLLEVGWPEPRDLDQGLRTAVVEALLTRGPAAETSPACGPRDLEAWIMRPGHPTLHDTDLAWYSAARLACASYDVQLQRFIVLTRTGWLDPVSGASRSWKRLRL